MKTFISQLREIDNKEWELLNEHIKYFDDIRTEMSKWTLEDGSLSDDYIKEELKLATLIKNSGSISDINKLRKMHINDFMWQVHLYFSGFGEMFYQRKSFKYNKDLESSFKPILDKADEVKNIYKQDAVDVDKAKILNKFSNCLESIIDLFNEVGKRYDEYTSEIKQYSSNLLKLINSRKEEIKSIKDMKEKDSLGDIETDFKDINKIMARKTYASCIKYLPEPEKELTTMNENVKKFYNLYFNEEREDFSNEIYNSKLQNPEDKNALKKLLSEIKSERNKLLGENKTRDIKIKKLDKFVQVFCGKPLSNLVAIKKFFDGCSLKKLDAFRVLFKKTLLPKFNEIKDISNKNKVKKQIEKYFGQKRHFIINRSIVKKVEKDIKGILSNIKS